MSKAVEYAKEENYKNPHILHFLKNFEMFKFFG